MVEIIPKETPQLPRWLVILFYLSFVLLIFSIISYFVLNSSFQKAQRSLKDLNGALISQETPEKAALKKEIINYQRKIEDFSQLVVEHSKTSEIFPLIEKNTHPQIWFSQFNLDAGDKTIDLLGQAASFESLGQQILIFKENEFINGVNLENVSISKTGEINFKLSLSLTREILK